MMSAVVRSTPKSSVSSPSISSLRTRTSVRPQTKRCGTIVPRATWTSTGVTKEDVSKNGGKQVVELNGERVLLVVSDDTLYSVSNKCSHLGLPLVGKTALLQGEIRDNCVVCPAHKTAFDLKTGEVQGEWCPGFPDLPLVGKMTAKKPLPTFESRVNESSGLIEVNMA